MNYIPKIFSSFRSKLLLWITGLVGILSTFFFIYFPDTIRDLQYNAIADKVVSITRTASVSAAGAVYFNDQNGLNEAIVPVLVEKNINFIIIHNDKDSIVYSYNLEQATKSRYKSLYNHKSLSDSLLIVSAGIKLFGEDIGEIFVGYSLDELNDQLKEVRYRISYISLIIILFSIVIAFFISKVITRPLAQVVNTVNEISNGDLTIRAPVVTEDEIAYLAKSFNIMVEKLINASKKYEKRSEKLQQEIKIRKKFEKDLLKSESRLRSIFDNASLGIFEIDIHGEILIVNDALLKIIGCLIKEECVSKNITDFFKWSSEKEKFIKLLADKDSVVGYETEWIDCNKKTITIRISFNKLREVKKGILSCVGTVEDITESQKAKIELAQNEFKYRMLFNLSPIGIIIEDLDGNIIDANPAFCENLGYLKDEILGNNISLISGPNNYEMIKNNINRLLNGEILNHTVENKTKEGTIKYIELYESIISLADGSEGVLCLVNDITDRIIYEKELEVAKEQAVKSDKLKSEFLAQMSHEIRTPVNTILSFISLIKEDIKEHYNEDIETSFKMIEGGGNRLIRTIDLILDMSQLQAGTFEVNKRNVDLIDFVLQPLINEFYYKAVNKGLKFTFEDNLYTKARINVDVYIITQTLVNLLDNAIKYTDEGEVKIILYKNDENYICIDVSDTGIGMSKSFMNNLFLPFSQEEQGYTRQYEGNGLGLSLVKKYCELSAAEINVKSEKDVGSTFTIVLPEKI